MAEYPSEAQLIEEDINLARKVYGDKLTQQDEEVLRRMPAGTLRVWFKNRDMKDPTQRKDLLKQQYDQYKLVGQENWDDSREF